MACILFCFSDGPVEGDPRYGRPQTFQVGLMDSFCKSPCCCLTGFFCPCASQYYLRNKSLDGDLRNYTCCQGYYNCCCFVAGSMGEQSCPELYLCCESFCFTSCAISATRQMVMDRYNLQTDPMDNRLIRFNNCIQYLACICNCLAMLDSSFAEIAQLLDWFAHCVWHSLVGCMTAQVNYELNFRNEMKRNPQVQLEMPQQVQMYPNQPQYAYPNGQQPVQAQMYPNQPQYAYPNGQQSVPVQMYPNQPQYAYPNGQQPVPQYAYSNGQPQNVYPNQVAQQPSHMYLNQGQPVQYAIARN